MLYCQPVAKIDVVFSGDILIIQNLKISPLNTIEFKPCFIEQGIKEIPSVLKFGAEW